MSFDLIIKGGSLALPEGLLKADLAINNGRIALISSSQSGLNANREIDATDKLVFPGIVDPHAHTNDPDYLYREDFRDASRAALIGGITTYIEMPLVKDIDNVGSLHERIRDGESNASIDFAIHAGFMREKNYRMIKTLSDDGVKSFKTFTCRPFTAADDMIYRIEENAAASNSITTFHAEDEVILNMLTSRAEGQMDQVAVHEVRPAEAESLAIYKAGMYARLTHDDIHIAHLSSELGVETVSYLKKLKVNITSETCPQYLLFTRKDVEEYGPYIKMSPSLKNSSDAEALWEALERGDIDMVSTDHAPGTKEEKEIGWKDPWKAWGGIPGLATMFPLIYTYGFLKGKLSLNSLIKVTSYNAARRFGLKGKGSIEVGKIADLIIVDPRYEHKVDGGELYKVGWSPFDKMLLKGWPQYVIRSGSVEVDNGQLVSKVGTGKFIRMER